MNPAVDDAARLLAIFVIDTIAAGAWAYGGPTLPMAAWWTVLEGTAVPHNATANAHLSALLLEARAAACR